MRRNKNASTAARLMGFPLPDRPHALVSMLGEIALPVTTIYPSAIPSQVLGSSESDIAMTDNLPGERSSMDVIFLFL